MKNKFTTIFVLMFITPLLIAAEVKISAEQVLDRVRKNLISLEAGFIQYEIDSNGIKSEDSTGKVWLNAPNQFKWQYQRPIPQLIVADGKKIWVYDEDLEQVTIKKQKSKQNPIYVLLNKKLTQDNYQVSLLEQKETQSSKIQWLQMLPKKPNDDVKMVLIGIDKNNLVSLKLQNQLDNIVVFEFVDITRNPKIKDTFFSFEIPKGVEVLRDGIEMGEF